MVSSFGWNRIYIYISYDTRYKRHSQTIIIHVTAKHASSFSMSCPTAILCSVCTCSTFVFVSCMFHRLRVWQAWRREWGQWWQSCGQERTQFIWCNFNIESSIIGNKWEVPPRFRDITRSFKDLRHVQHHEAMAYYIYIYIYRRIDSLLYNGQDRMAVETAK